MQTSIIIYIQIMKAANDKHSIHPTCNSSGINIEVATNLEETFTWVPPFIAPSNDALAGPEVISMDDVNAMFSTFKAERSCESIESIENQTMEDL